MKNKTVRGMCDFCETDDFPYAILEEHLAGLDDIYDGRVAINNGGNLPPEIVREIKQGRGIHGLGPGGFHFDGIHLNYM